VPSVTNGNFEEMKERKTKEESTTELRINIKPKKEGRRKILLNFKSMETKKDKWIFDFLKTNAVLLWFCNKSQC
jgi:hypothetical protein